VTRGVRVVDQPNKVTVVEDVVVVQVAAGIQGPQGPQGVQGPPGLDGTGAPIFGQVAKMTSGTITIATQGVYQSTGLTAVLDGENAGISLGTSDTFAIKNTSGATRRLKISASYDASMAGPAKVLGLALAINGVVDLDTECRATTGIQGAIAKLATAWIIDLADGDEVALYVANHSSTVDIDFERGRIVATSVAGFGPQGPTGATGPAGPGVATGGTTGDLLVKQSGTDFDAAWQAFGLDDLSDVDTSGISDGDALIWDQSLGLFVPTDDPLVPAGGATGQVLAKVSGSDYDTAWDDPSLIGAAASTTLASGAFLDGNGLVFGGARDNYARTPDAAPLDITGDIDLRVLITKADWGSGGDQQFFAKTAITNQFSYEFWYRATTRQLGFIWSSDGTVGSAVSISASVATFTDNQPVWLRATLDVDDGAGNRIIEFLESSDGTNWTSISTTTQAGPTSVHIGTSPLDIGFLLRANTRELTGTVHKAEIRDGINGTVVFDADFAAQTAGALAFTESSTNAATVTINTTRYTYGLPNVQWSTSNATQSLVANRVHYQPFLVTAPVVVDGTQFHVTSGPASAANVRTGIYRADDTMQPTGAPVLDAGDTAVGTSATGTFFTQVTPVTLQPGMYVTALNTSVNMTLRVQRGGLVGTDVGQGTSSIISLMYGAQTQGAFPDPPREWDIRTFGTVGPNHVLFLRWKAA
jgi:hypothetical protein